MLFVWLFKRERDACPVILIVSDRILILNNLASEMEDGKLMDVNFFICLVFKTFGDVPFVTVTVRSERDVNCFGALEVND